MDNIFADKLGNIIVANGVARLDFLTFKELHEDGKADLEMVLRLNMPIEGIMQAVDMLDRLKADLLAQGQVIQEHAPQTEQQLVPQQEQQQEQTEKSQEQLKREQLARRRAQAKRQLQAKLQQQKNS